MTFPLKVLHAPNQLPCPYCGPYTTTRPPPHPHLPVFSSLPPHHPLNPPRWFPGVRTRVEGMCIELDPQGGLLRLQVPFLERTALRWWPDTFSFFSQVSAPMSPLQSRVLRRACWRSPPCPMRTFPATRRLPAALLSSCTYSRSQERSYSHRKLHARTERASHPGRSEAAE